MPRLSKVGAAALAAFGWTGLQSVDVSYLVVAGGASGGGGPSGSHGGGGGGAGGYRTGTASLNPTLSYTVTVGAGGAGGSTTGVAGGDSTFSVTTSSGGGGGGANPGVATSVGVGSAGASGGGGSADGITNVGTAGGAGNTPSTSPAQGFAGGQGLTDNASYSAAGGGGGSSAVGAGGVNGQSGAGGAGTANSITGSSVTYAGGGGGGRTDQSAAGAGGSGGGGAGGTLAGNGNPGTANLGGGGGGAGRGTQTGGNGGSGIVIISYVGAQQFSGGVVTSVGGNTIHTFTTSGTLGPITTLSASYLVVGGGGGAGQRGGGGGGAGGYQAGSGLTIDPNSTYLVTVGAGGAGALASGSGNIGTAGSSSGFLATTSAGGGYGGALVSTTYFAGGAGGSGGGGCAGFSNTGAGAGGAGNTPSTSPAQGSNGGSGINGPGGTASAGGGGGSSAAGQTAPSTGQGGAGGAGTANSISGTSTYYAGGGGGAGNSTGGTGGVGGGGDGKSGTTNGAAGTANTGGGGGGGRNNTDGTSTTGGAGGSGVVIISYAGATQQMAGGTVTIVGGNVIHTFTNTGFLAPIDFSTGSLRFRSSNSAYLTRTPTVSGNQQKFTFSYWFKRGTLSAEQVMFGINSAGNEIFTLAFLSGNTFRAFGRNGGTDVLNLTTTQLFRDPAAWYHIVVAIDTTQATSSNRAIVYINGVQVTAFGTATYPAQNTSLAWDSSSYAHNIGRESTGNYIDGEMTEANFIDGQQLTPNSFGTFNSYGVWQPITYGGSYGTNGFYLPFNRQAVSFAGLFNGSNQYLSIASNSVFNQSGDFTIEYYANLTSNTNYQVAVGRGTGFINIQHSSDAGAMIRLVRYGQATIATGGNVTAGKWNHFAIVRSGSTVTGYLNGIAVASGTDSTSTATGNALAIGQNSDGTNYFTGSISNVRYTNTAVYTSNFIPSTSALTAVSGTQLLTLQNSSIVDNSTNALSITNNNTVTTGQTYPFAYGIFNDQGPAGNNWTPSNISGAFGSTLDYMGDAPTLTSAAVANYCTLNPLNFSTGTVSNGNLQWAATAGVGNGCFSTFAFNIASSTELYYWEFTFVSGDTVLGIAPTTLAPSNTSRPGSYSYYTNGNKYSGVSASSYGSSYAAGDTIGVAVGNGSITFYKNGVSQGVAFSSLTGTFTPAIWEVICTVSANFGQQPFKYTPPTNYVALNTYNL